MAEAEFLLAPWQAQAEIERVLGERPLPELADIPALAYVMRCINESMRLYPHPPVLLRRAQAPDVLPGGALMVLPGCGRVVQACHLYNGAACYSYALQLSASILHSSKLRRRMHAPGALHVGVWVASSGLKFMWCPPSELATATSGRVGDLR